MKDLADPRPFFATIEDVCGRHAAGPVGQRLVVNSLSSLLLEAPARDVFHELRAIIGRLRQTRTAALVPLDEGVHSLDQVQTVKHLCGGIIRTRKGDDPFFLRAEGLADAPQSDWVEYEFGHDRFDGVRALPTSPPKPVQAHP